MQEFKNGPYHSVQDMRLLIELISYTITAHHGIYDCIDEDGEDKFEVRLNVVEKEKLDEIARLWFEETAGTACSEENRNAFYKRYVMQSDEKGIW